jgi:tetratricopeptide (TPR) repeat protein
MANLNKPAAEDYFDLGTFSCTITTTSPDAQIWFNRGLVWTYGFNHEEAVRCFERAVAVDATCAMAYWGIAYSIGPNYNKPWEMFDSDELQTVVARAHDAALSAQKHAAKNSNAKEKALINAVMFRCPTSHVEDLESRSAWNERYAEAMGNVYSQFPSDPDVAALYADALMNMTPWDLWDINTGEPNPKAKTFEAKSVLEDAIQSTTHKTDHPGLLHLYIHLMEMSGQPELALPMADRLRDLVPDAGHLVHMPSHIDVLCGQWQEAIKANTSAISADDKFFAKAPETRFYTLYRAHDLHFKAYAAMFAGQKASALSAASELETVIPESLLQIRSPPMADWLEGFLSVKIHVPVRFGLWQEILALPLPQDQNLYSTTTATLHYAQALSHANTGSMARALESQALFKSSLSRVPASRTLFNNKCIDVLAIADTMLDAEIKFRTGRVSESFAAFDCSVTLCDSLPYDEPWGWMQPPRHAYGALMLELADDLLKGAGEKEAQEVTRLVKAAADLYESDLGLNEKLPRVQRHPMNVWALRGYVECLDRNHDLEAGIGCERSKEVREMLRKAEEGANVEVKASCACRVERTL